MGTTLTGKRVQNTYDSLLKIGDNDNLTGTAKRIGDGLGNDSPIFLSTTQIGIGVTPSFEFHVNSHAKIGGNLIVGGNLTVDGTTTIVDSTVVAIGDNMIELAKDNVANVKDIGWYGTINSSGDKYVGMFYDASDGVTVPTFRVGLGTSEPGSTMTITTKGKLVIAALDASTGVFSGQVTIPATPVASTDAASKGYVDSQITAQDLDIAGDSGSGAVDLDSQTFTISGGTNVTTSVSGQTVTINASGGIDGSGTANDVVMWQDSDTLTDAPIAVSGNNTTFAGNITFGAVNAFSQSTNVLDGTGTNGARIRSAVSAAGTPTFSNSDDTDTGMFFPSANSVAFSTGGTQALAIDTSQNATFAGTISSGAITSTGDITSNGNIITQTTSGNKGIKVITANDAEGFLIFGDAQDNSMGGMAYNNATNTLDIDCNNGVALSFDSSRNATFSGNINIESSNPKLKLRDTDGGYAELAANNTDLVIKTDPDNVVGSSTIQFEIDGTEYMRLQQQGRLGIGTTSPTADLSVGSTSTSSGDVHLRTTKTAFSITPSNSNAGGILLDLGFVSGGQGPMKFGIGGSEKMQIDSSGLTRFTVDTTTASAIDIGYVSSARTIRAVETGGGNARPLTLLAQNFTFKDDLATRITINSSGNVGIGTTSPNAKLQVRIGGIGSNANDEVDGVIFEGDRHDLIYKQIRTGATSDWNSTTTRLQNRVDTTLMSSIDFVTDASFQRHIDINTASNSFNTRFTHNGRVGIGTSSPARKLHVNAGTDNEAVRIESSDTEVAVELKDSTGTATIRSRGDFRFDGSSGEIMRMESGGDVGIGTTNPDQKLVVNQTTTGRYVFKGEYNGTNLGGFFVDGSQNMELFLKAAGNVEKVKIDTAGNSHFSGGNVGIGISSPGEKLDVYGNIKLGTTANSNVLNRSETHWVQYNGGATTNNTYLRVASVNATSIAKTVSIFTNASERVRVQSDGRVGIGTSSPQQNFHVAGSALIGGVGNSLLFDTDGVTATNGIKTINLYETVIFNGRGSAGFGVIGNQNIRFGFGSNYTNAETDLFINSSGNVGIGTTSPDHILCIEDSEPTLRIFDASNTLNQEQTIAFGTEPGNRTHAEVSAINTNTGNASGSLSFKTNSGSSLSERVRITQDGNVGIGTTSPSSVLHINTGSGTSNANTVFIDRASSSDYSAITFATAGTVNWSVGQNSAGAFEIFRNGLASKTRFSLNHAGTLTIKDDIIAFGSPSDKRLKENIKPIQSALDKVCKLQGVKFDWKENDSILEIKKDIGFIAQDVQKVLPELVRVKDDGMLSLRHQGIVPVLLEAIKELKQEVEELKKQIK